MSTQSDAATEHKLDKLKRADKVAAGRKGGVASRVARAERKAAYAELEQALEANAYLPGAKALIRSTLAAYGLILRMQNPAGPRQPDIRGVSALLSGFTANLERLGMLPDSTSRPPSPVESGAQLAAPQTTPTQPNPAAERVFTQAEFAALTREEQSAWLCNRNGTFEIVDNPPEVQP